jgi:hypothetical protein
MNIPVRNTKWRSHRWRRLELQVERVRESNKGLFVQHLRLSNEIVKRDWMEFRFIDHLFYVRDVRCKFFHHGTL